MDDDDEREERAVIRVPAQKAAQAHQPPLDLSAWLYRPQQPHQAAAFPHPPPPPPSAMAAAAAAAAAAAYHLQLPPNILASKFAGERGFN